MLKFLQTMKTNELVKKKSFKILSLSLYVLVIGLLFLIIYNTFFVDFLLLIYHKPLHLSIFYFKSLVIVVILSLAFFGLSLKINYDKKLIILYIAYICYGFISIIFDKLYLGYPLKYSVYLFYRFYNLPVVILLVSSLKISRDKDGQNSYYDEILSKKLFKLWLIVLLSLSPIILLLNIGQHFYNDIYDKNILPLLNFNITGRFGHTVIIFINNTYCVSIAVIMLSILLFFKTKIPAKIILVVGLLATIATIYWTYLRTDYLGLTLAIFSILLIYFYKKYGNKNKIYKFIIYTLPAINLAFTILLILFIVFIHIHGNKAINSSSSLYERLHEWQFMADKFILNGNIFNLFFGHGIIEYGLAKVAPWRPNIPALLHLKPSLLLFDNTYLQVVLYNGIISLVFFLALFVYIWKLLLKLFTVIPENQFYFYAYVLTIFATLPAMFMFDNFNSLYNIYAVIPAFIVLIAYNKTNQSKIN